MKPIALQLYSVRDLCAEAFEGTVAEVADIGYVGVECAGFHGMSVEDAAAMYCDLGLTCCSQHGPLPTPENAAQIAADCKTLGAKYTVSGFGPDDMKTIEGIKACAARFQTAAEVMKAHGITFAFHNHWWEFTEVDGQLPYDIIMESAPDAMSQLDVYWTQFGGSDPVEVIKKWGSRIPLLHAKDGPLTKTDKGPDPHTAVGKGKLNFPAIIGATDPKVLEWIIVELDFCATDMMEAVADSHDYLTGEGLAAGK